MIKLEYDATPSWSGYTYQGKSAILVALKKLNELRTINPNCNMSEYCLELEWIEDFAIMLKSKSGTWIYESIHQVKARRDLKLSSYSNALIKLLQKVEANNDIKNAYLHTIEKIDYQDDWLSELKEISVNSEELRKWIMDIDNLLSNKDILREFFSKLPKKRDDFSRLLRKQLINNKITLDNIEEALSFFKLEIEGELVNIQKGFSDITFHKVSLFPNCALDEIENLIRAEIVTYLKNYDGKKWKIYDASYQDIVLRCLIGIIDTHIMNRHKNYGSIVIEKLYFQEFVDVLNSDNPVERCKEYYLFIIKEKLLEYWDNYTKICYEDCVNVKDYSSCKVCQMEDFKSKILEMSFEEIHQFVMLSNPDISTIIDNKGFINYCEKNRYFNPFYNGIREVFQKFGDDKIPITYTDSDKKLYLLTTISDNGISNNTIKKVCQNIVENEALFDLFMDYEVIISKDLESASVLHDAGDFMSDFKMEKHNIYHLKDVSMKKLESCKAILN